MKNGVMDMPENYCGYDVGEIKDILKIRLSKKRYVHSLDVAQTAEKLAERYNGDRERAYLAGLVHDICKEIPIGEQLEMAMECGRDFSPAEQLIPPLYHSAAGAWYCENVLDIKDEDILNAVRYHTAARDGMSLLEEIIYIADLTSEDRTYKDVGKMRRLSMENLQEAMLAALSFSVRDVVGKNSLLPDNTVRAYNYYVSLLRG